MPYPAKSPARDGAKFVASDDSAAKAVKDCSQRRTPDVPEMAIEIVAST